MIKNIDMIFYCGENVGVKPCCINQSKQSTREDTTLMLKAESEQ